MLARLLLVARFAVYAAIIAVGVHVLLSRDEAGAGPPRPAGKWYEGETSRQLPVAVQVREHQVVALTVEWEATCDNGEDVRWKSGFRDMFPGDFKRDGQRFEDDWTTAEPMDGDRTAEIHARVSGQATDGVARGSVGFEIAVHDDGERVADCESGPVGFAVDLPSR